MAEQSKPDKDFPKDPAVRMLLGNFEYSRKALIKRMECVRSTLDVAIRQLSDFDVREALDKGRLTIPINSLGVLQSQGPMLDNECGSLGTLYHCLKEISAHD